MKKIYYLIIVLFAFSQQILFADTNPTKNSLQNTKENSTVYGPWITDSWSMSYPYNMLCPDDPYSSRKCLAGEIPLVFAHIIHCHKNIDDVYFDDSDDYFSDPIYIDDDYLIYNFPSFPELNAYLDTIRYNYNNNLSLDYELISALNFACGIATNHQYVYGGTILQNVYHVFVDKFNYNNATYVSIINDDFYLTLKNNMIEAKPAILAISAPGYGKIVICDGYASVTDKYHVKFLWFEFEYRDGWYNLPDGLPSGFNTIDVAVVDIEPPTYSIDELPNGDPVLHNSPNPFRTSTKFSFSSNNHIQNAELKIYNIKGQLVRDFSIVTHSPSRSVSVTWDGKDNEGNNVSSGLYFFQFKNGDDIIGTNKCLLIKD